MPTDRQISQLVLQVDANIAVAQRELQNLARVVNQSSGQMNAALGSTEAAHRRLGSAFNNSRIAQMELSHVVTASVDAYAAGASPLRILTLEMGRVAEAATFMGGAGGSGALGKVAGFLGGPWGIAVLVGVSVLSQLIGKMGSTSTSVADLVEKMRVHAHEAANSKAADEQWAHSIDGLIERSEKLTDDLKKRLKAEEDLDSQTLRSAQHDRAAAEEALKQDKTRLANLQRQLSLAQQQPVTGGGSVPGAEAAARDNRVAGLVSQVDRAKEAIVRDQKAISDAQAEIVNSTITVGQNLGKALADSGAAIDLWAKNYAEALHAVETRTPQATAQITESFETLKRALGDAAGAKVGFKGTADRANELARDLLHGRIGVVQYAEAMKALAASLERVVEAANNAKKGTGELGKQIGFADAEAIAKGAGLTVTSGYRSTAHQRDLYNDPSVRRPGNPVARPGTSAHEGVNGKWALDIAFAPGLTADRLKKLYGGEGVSLSAVYKERGHFHIEGSRSEAATAERQAQRDQVAGIHQQSAFDQASDRLDQELLQAQSQLAGSYNQRAQIADQEVSAETKKLTDSIQEQLELGKATDYQQGITEAQAKILRAKVGELDKERKAAVELQRYLQALDSIQQTTDQRYQFATSDLHFADDMARTQADHRKIQLEILDITYQQKEYDLRILLAKQQLAGDLEAAARTQAEINRLPQDKAQDQKRVEQGTLSPLEQWAKTVPQTAAQINEALQSIEAQGLERLAGSIADVVTGTKSLGEAFKDVSREIIGEILQMIVKMLIFRAISAALGSFGGGGGAGGPISVSSGTSSYFGANPFGGFRAGGGPVAAGKSYVVGEKGPEVFVAGSNGAIIPSASRISIPNGSSSMAPQKVQVELEVSGSELLEVRMVQVSNAVVEVKKRGIVKEARDNAIQSISRRAIGG